MRTRLFRTVLRQVGRPPDGAADADLVRRFTADRDEAAFAELVRRHARLVWGVCRNLLPDDADAEDAFQATFLALVRGAGGVKAPHALGGWLHGVAYRVCQKARRSAARRRQRERAVAAGEAVTPVADATWEHLLAAVHEEVCRLPDAQRVPFVLCCLEGKGVSEAAAQLGWKLGTLSGRLTRAKQTVLARLARRGIAPGVAAVAAVVSGEPAASAAGSPPVGRALGLIDPDGVVSGTVLHLSQGVTHMGLSKVKLMAAGMVVATAVGVTVWSHRAVPTADAQQPMTADDYLRAYQRALGGTATTPPPAKAQWEYKFVNFGDEGYEKKANDLGKDGWELAGGPVGGTNFFFKRPKPGAATTGAGPAVNSFRSTLSRVEPADADTTTALVPLKNAKLTPTVEAVASLFAASAVAVTGDARSNTLIVKGSAGVVKEVKELIERLDALPDKNPTNPPRR